MTISELAEALDTNRSATLSILNLLVGSGEISMRTFGRAKVYTLSPRIPVARLMSLSADLFLILDDGLYIEDYNDLCASFFKIENDSIKGSNFIYTPIPNFFSVDIVQAVRDAASGTRRIFEGYVGEGIAESYFRISCIPIQENDFSTKVALVLHDLTIHKKYEEELERELKDRTDELKTSAERFEILTDLAPVGIYETDAGGKCIYVNQKWCDIAEITFEEALGTGWEQAIHPDDREWVKKLWYEHARDEISWNLTYRFQKKDGSITHVLGIAIALRDHGGKVVGYLGTNIDLTDRMEAEGIIQNLNTRLSSIVESAYDGIATLDKNKSFISCNKAGCEILGYSEPDLIGKNINLLYPDEKKFQEVDAFISQKVLKSGHCRGITKIAGIDGEERIIEISLSQLVCNNELSGIIAIFRDVSDRYQQEMKMMQHEGELRSILDGFIDAVGVIDKEGTILYANPSAIHFLTDNYTENPVGRNISDFVPSEQVQLLIPYYQKVIRSQKPLSRKLTVTLHGEDVTFMNRLIPIHFGSNKIPAVLSMSLDISHIDINDTN